MFGKKPTVTPIAGGRDDDSSQSKPGSDRAYQIAYGRLSRIAIRVLEDRVKRTLFMYEYRAAPDSEHFIRFRLPDGKLPGDDFLEEHRDGVIMHWAREDADCFLDAMPPKHAHEDAVDEGAGMPMQVRDPQPAPQPTRGATPQPAQSQPAAHPDRMPPPASPPPAPEAEQPTQQTEPRQAPPKKKVVRKPQETAQGIVRFAGVRTHSAYGRRYSCYTVDIQANDGVTYTFRGALLEDRMHQAGAGIGDHVLVQKLGQQGKKNVFEITKY